MRRKILFPAIFIIIAVVALFAIYSHIRSGNNFLTVSGRVEADEIELSARVPGRLESVLIEDGKAVGKGDLIAQIDDREIESKKRETLDRIDELVEKIKSAGLDLDYTSSNADHSFEEATKFLAAAEAKLKQTEAKKENAEKELKRYSSLIEKGVVTRQKFDNVRLAFELAREDVTVASKEVERAKVSLAKAGDLQKLVKAKEKELSALKKTLDQRKENLRQIEINVGYTRVTAPLDGVILRKVGEPGEVVQPGGVIGVMINPDDIYVKTYVPEKYIGKMHLDMSAEVFTDAYPGKPFKGYVCYISDKAEFTPKEVQSYEERAKEVFAAKICFDRKKSASAKGEARREVLKKGMPVDVKFNIKTKE